MKTKLRIILEINTFLGDHLTQRNMTPSFKNVLKIQSICPIGC